MERTICWKCRRSVEPLERRERDKKSRKTWLITYCPFDRCAANLDITKAPPVKLWNGSFFEDPDETNADKD